MNKDKIKKLMRWKIIELEWIEYSLNEIENMEIGNFKSFVSFISDIKILEKLMNNLENSSKNNYFKVIYW